MQGTLDAAWAPREAINCKQHAIREGKGGARGVNLAGKHGKVGEGQASRACRARGRGDAILGGVVITAAMNALIVDAV